MEGYEVVTSEDEKVGHVVASAGENLIVERGTLFKSRYVLPKVFGHADDAERAFRVSLSKQILEEAPKVEGDDEIDDRMVAEYYGLADAPGARTEGYGDVTSDDPGSTAEEEGGRLGVVSAPEERAQVRKTLPDPGSAGYGPAGRPIIPPDPHE